MSGLGIVTDVKGRINYTVFDYRLNASLNKSFVFIC